MAVELVHATVIAAGGRAVLIRGPSGSGKSDLALRCLALAPGLLTPEPAMLLADDQVMLERMNDKISARAPAAIAGKLEVHGLGILTTGHVCTGPVGVALVADLVTEGQIDRLPDPWPFTMVLGIPIPVLQLRPFEASAPLKLLLALRSASLPLLG